MKRKLHNEEFYYASTSPDIVRPKLYWEGSCGQDV